MKSLQEWCLNTILKSLTSDRDISKLGINKNCKDILTRKMNDMMRHKSDERSIYYNKLMDKYNFVIVGAWSSVWVWFFINAVHPIFLLLFGSVLVGMRISENAVDGNMVY